jgi:SPFH domain / Band 7 family
MFDVGSLEILKSSCSVRTGPKRPSATLLPPRKFRCGCCRTNTEATSAPSPANYSSGFAPPSTSDSFTMAQSLGFVYRSIIPLAIGASLLQQSIYDVKGGSRAVIFDRISGVKEQVVNEGTHFLIPWLQRAIVFDVRTKPRNIATTTGSKDLQMVSLTLRVLHRPDVKSLPKIYQVSYGTGGLPIR